MIIHCSKNEKGITFGKVTFWSWIKAYFSKSGHHLKVVPIKGYEKYNYYPDYLCAGLDYGKLINELPPKHIPLNWYIEQKLKGNDENV